MLAGLSAIHPVFAQWYRQGWTRKKANRPLCKMPPELEELTELFEQGRSYTDYGHKLMADLGYSVSAWNGAEGSHGMHFRVHAGDYTVLNPFPNYVDLVIPSPKVANADLVNAATLRAVLLTLVEAWEPSWANILDWIYRGKAFGDRPLSPLLGGWMTYLSAPYARKIVPPSSAIAEAVAGGGILMCATNEVFDADNPQHVAAANAIQSCLAPLQSNPRLIDV
jgi:hypothetical protein